MVMVMMVMVMMMMLFSFKIFEPLDGWIVRYVPSSTELYSIVVCNQPAIHFSPNVQKRTVKFHSTTGGMMCVKARKFIFHTYEWGSINISWFDFFRWTLLRAPSHQKASFVRTMREKCHSFDYCERVRFSIVLFFLYVWCLGFIFFRGT